MIRKPVAVLLVVMLVSCGAGDRLPAGVVSQKNGSDALGFYAR